MKVALIDINGKTVNGESMYLLHLQAGLKQNGIQADIYSINYFGRPLAYSMDTEGAKDCDWKWLSFKNMDILKEYDIIHINGGKFKEMKYDFMKTINDMKKPITLSIHGLSGPKTYNLNKLYEVITPLHIFSMSKAVCRTLNSPNTFVHLPFAKEIMPEPKNVRTQNIITIPARFTFAKYMGDILDMLLTVRDDSNVDFKAYFYGNEDFCFHLVKEKWNKLDDNVQLLPMYGLKDKPDVYAANLMIDATQVSGDGEKWQYTHMEAMFYGTVPMTKPIWYFEDFKPDVNVLRFNKENVLNALGNGDFLKEVIESNKKVLDKYSAKNIAQQFIEVWERL